MRPLRTTQRALAGLKARPHLNRRTRPNTSLPPLARHPSFPLATKLNNNPTHLLHLRPPALLSSPSILPSSHKHIHCICVTERFYPRAPRSRCPHLKRTTCARPQRSFFKHTVLSFSDLDFSRNPLRLLNSLAYLHHVCRLASRGSGDEQPRQVHRQVRIRNHFRVSRAAAEWCVYPCKHPSTVHISAQLPERSLLNALADLEWKLTYV